MSAGPPSARRRGGGPHPDAADRPMQEALTFKRTPLGLLTQEKGSPVLFGDIVERLRRLTLVPETAAARAEVDAVLACRWWGLRVVAIKAIGSWGGAANKAWLIQRACRPPPCADREAEEPHWWGIETRAAWRAVAPALDDTDADWVLTLAHENVYAGIDLSPYVRRIPDAVFLAWLPTPLRRSRGRLRVRLANMVGRRRTLPGYATILQTLADGDDEAARTARRLIAEGGQGQP